MSIIKYQKGNKLPQDYDLFLKYSETVPENRRPQADWSYGNPDQYDHYGMWDALGKPKDFKEALEKNPDWKPNELDNLYHGFSTNPNTGVWLKSHTPGKHDPSSTAWMENLSFQLSGDKNWNPNKFSLVYDPEIKRMRYLEKYQKGKKFTPPPGWKPREEKPLPQLNPDYKSDTEKQTNRRLQEGADAQKQIVDQQLTFNNIVNGQLNLNPNAMLYSRPTVSERNQEVQKQNVSTGLQNFARTTQPTITKAIQGEMLGQLPSLFPQAKQVVNKVQTKIDNYIPGSIDKLIKPKYNVTITGKNTMGLGNKQTIHSDLIKDMTPLKPGAENFVFHKGDNVFKIRRPEMTIDNLSHYKKELRLLQKNAGMPNTKIQGYYKSEKGDLLPILKQEYIPGTRPEYSEIQQFMQTKKFKPDQDLFRNKTHVIFDTHPGNFIKDYYGKIHNIDTHILNKHQFAKYQSQVPSLQLQSYRKGGLIKYKTK